MEKKLQAILFHGNHYVFKSQKKIIFYFFIIVGIIFLIFNGIFYKLYSDNIRDIVVKENQFVLTKALEYVNLIIKNVENTSDIIKANPLIQARLDSKQQDSPMDYMEYSQIISVLQGIVHAMEGAASIDLYLDEQKVIMSTDYGLSSNLDQETIEYFRGLPTHEQNVYLTDQYRERLKFYSNRNGEQITFITPIYVFSTGTWEGVLCINIDKYMIKNIIKGDENSGIVILDGDGRILISTFLESYRWNERLQETLQTLTAPQGTHFERYERENQAFLFDTSPYTGWKFVSVVSMGAAMDQMTQLRDYILILFFGMNGITAVALILLMSGKIYRKLNRLIVYMRQVEKGDFDTVIEQYENDEFGYMYASFNNMVYRIKTLFDELLQQRMLQKDAQLKLLQSKINPHFIYNIFDNMNWLIELERYEELSQLVEAVSTHYKKILNAGKDFITVKDTIEQLKSYVDIQLIRFNHRFDCSFEIEETLLDVSIPNFILQPLLENAICHGIEPKIKRGRIVIKGYEARETITFFIEDNGVGIDKEKLDEINNFLESKEIETESYFALANINKRIKLYYGEKYGLKIYSEKGIGTKVVLRIRGEDVKSEGERIC